MSKLLSVLLATVFAAVTVTPVFAADEMKKEEKKEVKKEKKAKEREEREKRSEEGRKEVILLLHFLKRQGSAPAFFIVVNRLRMPDPGDRKHVAAPILTSLPSRAARRLSCPDPGNRIRRFPGRASPDAPRRIANGILFG